MDRDPKRDPRRDSNRDPRRDGPAERAAAALPPPAGRAFRFVVVSLLAVSTGALVAVAALAALIYLRLQTAVDVAPLKADIAGVKAETASFHADVTKAMAALQKGMADTANEVNSATLQLNDIALSLHKRP